MIIVTNSIEEYIISMWQATSYILQVVFSKSMSCKVSLGNLTQFVCFFKRRKSVSHCNPVHTVDVYRYKTIESI